MSRSSDHKIAPGRSGARELAMMLFYQMEAQNDFELEIKTTFVKENVLNKKQREYVDAMYTLLCEHLSQVDLLIERASDNWTINRIDKIDLAVLRVAVLEIMNMDDIPKPVSINEAVNVAKKYGTSDSGKFVNGILGKIDKIVNENETN